MKIICIGRNYVEHAKELGNKILSEPVIFMKPKTAIPKSNFKVYHPFNTIDWQAEAEVVIKISKNGRNVPEELAHEYYSHYTIGLDMTARDVQSELKDKGLPWEMAKSQDCSAVLGDFVPVYDDTDVQNLDFELIKNGEVVQEANTSDMVFSVRYLISYISQYFTLNIGDLLFTGTPAGVPGVDPGDELVGYIDGEKLLTARIV